jgi:hypothetical protein
VPTTYVVMSWFPDSVSELDSSCCDELDSSCCHDSTADDSLSSEFVKCSIDSVDVQDDVEVANFDVAEYANVRCVQYTLQSRGAQEKLMHRSYKYPCRDQFTEFSFAAIYKVNHDGSYEAFPLIHVNRQGQPVGFSPLSINVDVLCLSQTSSILLRDKHIIRDVLVLTPKSLEVKDEPTQVNYFPGMSDVYCIYFSTSMAGARLARSNEDFYFRSLHLPDIQPLTMNQSAMFQIRGSNQSKALDSLDFFWRLSKAIRSAVRNSKGDGSIRRVLFDMPCVIACQFFGELESLTYNYQLHQTFGQGIIYDQGRSSNYPIGYGFNYRLFRSRCDVITAELLEYRLLNAFFGSDWGWARRSTPGRNSKIINVVLGSSPLHFSYAANSQQLTMEFAVGSAYGFNPRLGELSIGQTIKVENKLWILIKIDKEFGEYYLVLYKRFRELPYYARNKIGYYIPTLDILNRQRLLLSEAKYYKYK